ncbi:MAG TPA: hypothetical protein VG406_00490 [Isosphaeraceae bacterium]|jgi:hypothetical protein|nr:hypothetical protein [Isosphaeraceae bacterium]
MRSGSGNGLGRLVARAALALGVLAGPSALGAEWTRVPLGGSLTNQDGDKGFSVYVPTRFGGVLTIATTGGELGPIKGPDGRERLNGGEIGDNQQGWYTFDVRGAKAPFAVTTSFVQVGQSTRMPWNFYYWPTKGDSVHEPWAGGNGRVDTMGPAGDDVMVATPGSYIAPGQDVVLPGPDGILDTRPAPGDTSTWFPNLYDDLTWLGPEGTLYATPSPLLKFDQLFNSSARRWEAANSQNRAITRWPGHCLGGAIASIMLNEPIPAPGSGFTADELKGMWAELGENHLNHKIGDYANNIPAGPPRPGFDPTDAFVARFHTMLEQHIRGRHQSLLGNLRAFPPNGTPDEVWNHGIGKYTAKFHAIPGRGERAVRLEVEVVGNAGANLNNGDNKPRLVKYEYSLVYGLNGQVDESNPMANDWIAVGGDGMYAPLNLLEVVDSRWQGHNPYVTEANVRSIDLANGGFGPRTVAGGGTAPSFRPVRSYEAGRGPIFAFGNNGNGPGGPGGPRRGLFGLFRFGR